MRCIVTGGAGFLGSHLTERLVAMGHSVVVIDDMFRGKKKNVEGCKGMPDYYLMMGDAANRDIYEKASDKMGGVDCIFHLAAINGTRWFHERPDFVIQVNLDTLRTALDFAKVRGARFVFTSSPEAFGEQPEMPLRNDSESLFSAAEKHGRHSYGASKYLGEILVQHAVKEHSLDARIVRPFNGYGPRLPGDSYGQVTGIFLKQCHTGETITIHGDGEQTRSFTWVEDIVEGIQMAGELDQGIDGSNLAGAAFNLGSAEEISITDLAQICLEITGSNSEIEFQEVGHPGDSQRRLPDLSTSELMLGWSANVSLRQGIESCWRWQKAEQR
ncbi:MAG: SDR family NAD(P)-dependent oxidoreductase [Candidatus Thalassarchaeaceae archaeon]|nr:SDR family NAD(P)-dependent oxidoreductase [Candidatus Thalassarchaeaceae archaeon]